MLSFGTVLNNKVFDLHRASFTEGGISNEGYSYKGEFISHFIGDVSYSRTICSTVLFKVSPSAEELRRSGK